MNPSEYVNNALRTEHTPDFVRLDGADAVANRRMARLLHATLGLMTEVGEIADALKKKLIYGKDLDLVNLAEEHGDESWYMALLVDAIGSSFETSWELNIAKLRKRFPDKFEASRALNRDLDAERAALEASPRPAVRGRDYQSPLDRVEREVYGDPYRDAPAMPSQRHRETPPDQRHAYAPYVPCKSCDDAVCLTVRTLQEEVAALRKERNIYLEANVELRQERTALKAERDGARVECENWKRRAERHGCDVVSGDLDCG